MDTKTIANSASLLLIGLINLIIIDSSLAQDKSCNNYWINPSSGKEECFDDASIINLPLASPSSDLSNSQNKEECLSTNPANCNNDLKNVPVETKALFATILPTGVIPVADRPVLVMPCAPTNNECKEIESYLVEILKKTKDLNKIILTM